MWFLILQSYSASITNVAFIRTKSFYFMIIVCIQLYIYIYIHRLYIFFNPFKLLISVYHFLFCLMLLLKFFFCIKFSHLIYIMRFYFVFRAADKATMQNIKVCMLLFVHTIILLSLVRRCGWLCCRQELSAHQLHHKVLNIYELCLPFCFSFIYPLSACPGEYCPSIFDKYSAPVKLEGRPVNLGLEDTGRFSLFDNIDNMSSLICIN